MDQKPETAGKGEQGPSLPAISLPKGGGAIRGIGEKFSANPVTGTGSLSVPLAASPGRSGFGPQLSLSYDSGAGNGPFGFGWSLGLPSITRKTDKGLPRYLDADESDVFLLSGAEDLVPILDGAGNRVSLPPRTVHQIQYRIHLYRPRIEGLFARIERWTRTEDGVSHWRTITRDNVTTIFGFDENSRIFDPHDSRRIFSYLISSSFDDKGNLIRYEYVAEDSSGVKESAAHEANRTDDDRSTQRYLKHVRYGNTQPCFPDGSPNAEVPFATEWHFQIVFDYGDHRADAPAPAHDPALDPEWPVRPDPFSTYRAGFEVRTYRRCERVLLFHNFPGEPGVGADCLVRSTDFLYSDETAPADPRNPIYTFLESVTQTGYRRKPGGYEHRSTPPLEFFYSQPEIHPEILTLDDAESRANLPEGLDGGRFRWVDLDGEGLNGILTEQNGGWGYKRNLGPINQVTLPGGERVARARFGPLERIASLPVPASLSGGQQLLDLTGEGRPELVAFDATVPGFFARTADEDWEPLKPFSSLPRLSWSDPHLKFVDLTGDGRADVLMTEENLYTFYPSLGVDGFGEAERVFTPWDEERGPRVVLADGTQTVSLADMSGDGLSDIVRVRNGEVCYWPNLGYGRFGAKVTMDGAPRFTDEERFDARRIQLADIDGSGTTDILYVGHDGVQVCFNRSGNSWASPQRLAVFPDADDLSSVQVADLLGNGTACLVWSSPLPGESYASLRYVDLMGSQKPHLMVRSRNNLGAETRLSYASSTRFYLEDKQAGRPWITRLPFPVHVVERVETYDWISRSRFATRYAYHHGYFDGVEREFRGFGMVEQWDTEELAALNAGDAFPDAVNLDTASHVPPAYTKTWFHTGAYFEGKRISRHFEDEYHREGDPGESVAGLSDAQLEAMLLPDTLVPNTILQQDGSEQPWTLSAEETRQACRALKGAVLRQEVYARDGTDAEDRPYSASERNYTVELLQPRGRNRHAVFFTHARETIGLQYERELFDVNNKKLADPRVTHAMTLKVDAYGNVLQSVAIGYGRRHQDPDPLLTAQDHQKQNKILVTYTENGFTESVDADDAYRSPLPGEARTYEILKLAPDAKQPQVTNLFGFEELRGKLLQAGDGNHDLPYKDAQAAGAAEDHPYRRLIEHVRTLYRKDDLTGPLALGQLQPLALPFESYKLAFTAGFAQAAYVDSGKLTAADLNAVLLNQGGYAHSGGDADWWIPSGRVFLHPDPNAAPAQELTFAKEHFFLARRFRDPFEQDALVRYDDYDLLGLETEDALHNKVTSGERDSQGNIQNRNDYRVLQPALVTDPNGNRGEVAFDVLGLVAGTAVMGKTSETKGDSLQGFVADLSQAQIDAFFADPQGEAAELLGSATTRTVYDPDRYFRTGNAGKPGFAASVVRERHVSDLQPGEVSPMQVSWSYSDGFGREIQKKIQAEPGPVSEGGPAVNPRWVGSGWTIFNNKGKPVRQYEPFFSATHDFEFAKTLGVSPTLFYDPVGRVVATLHPNHTYGKVRFDPWRQETWDVNDTVTLDPGADPHVGPYFARLVQDDYLPTWRDLRTSPACAAQAAQLWPDVKLRTAEADAANKAAAHANTPAVAYMDTLGRAFLTIADNAANGKYATRVELDIEGNQRWVADALERKVMTYDYDMLGTRVHQASMEAGERWMLNDVTGKPIRAWDSLGHAFRTEYDELRRPVRAFVQGADPQDPTAEILFAKTEYGEGQPDDTALNLRTRVFRQSDGAGVVTHMGHDPITNQDEAYDFKGNPLRSTRQLAHDYKAAPNWSDGPQLEPEIFTNSSTFDALNRPVTLTTPDDTVIRPSYNEANLLETLAVNLQGTVTATVFVTDIDYDAKGQRERIEYGNGATTNHDYDPLTFRLTRLITARPANLNGVATQIFKSAGTVQDLRYTYDPAGNITRIADDALPVLFHANQQVEPVCLYTYDALYHLIEARGREHVGQSALQLNPPNGNYRDHPFAGLGAQPLDPQAVRNYTEQYGYDGVGNFLHWIHQAQSGNWERDYNYQEPSLIEPGKVNNRLSNTVVHPNGNQPVVETYTHDAHGNMTAMPHLAAMAWDFKDQFQSADLGGGGAAFYVYSAAGQRVRRVIERQNGTRQKERLYLGGYEVYREYDGAGSAVTLERETLHVMDDKQRIALAETRTQGNDSSPQQLVRYQLGNHLGSASLELDDAGQVISYEEYYPYGGTSYQAGRSAAEVSLKRYRYTGKERDEESGLCQHGARYEAPWLGRWTSCDPAGLVDGGNRYRYARNNPVRYVDPLGTEPLVPPQSSDVGFMHLVPTGQKDTPIWQWYGEVGDLIISVASRVSVSLPDGTTAAISPEKILIAIAHARAETVTKGIKPLGLNYFNIQGGEGTAGQIKVTRKEFLPKKDQKVEPGKPVEKEWRNVTTTTRAYKTGQDAVQDYFDDLKTNRPKAFASLVASKETVNQFVDRLAESGFGSDPAYKKKFLETFNEVVDDYKKLTDEQIRISQEEVEHLKSDLGRANPSNTESITILKRSIQSQEKRILQLQDFKKKISAPTFRAVVPGKPKDKK